MLLRMALFFLNYPVRISQKSCRATHALQTRGVKFPANVNPRGTREFKDEYKKQLKLFRQEHAAKIAAKKEAAQKAAQQPAAEEAAQ